MITRIIISIEMVSLIVITIMNMSFIEVERAIIVTNDNNNKNDNNMILMITIMMMLMSLMIVRRRPEGIAVAD